MPEALYDMLVKSAPFYGPVIALEAVALAWVTVQWRASMAGRVDDAKETTKVLLASSDKLATALNGVTAAGTASRTELERLTAAVESKRR